MDRQVVISYCMARFFSFISGVISSSLLLFIHQCMYIYVLHVNYLTDHQNQQVNGLLLSTEYRISSHFYYCLIVFFLGRPSYHIISETQLSPQRPKRLLYISKLGPHAGYRSAVAQYFTPAKQKEKKRKVKQHIPSRLPRSTHIPHDHAMPCS
ncbi:hypothetical protein ASPBRDRAFT_628140 [Aspergillus brasiliensis CBS 101740]|uniref:Uncharacterized protein n=1 Tax=Aspergillus brasiliensis (strain CBS 101740 / IMI 381727 / IBT 21946) TaxID=767769 RepID=A0A1L9UG23_ASPBC|nr:hypothetical protein ASPBRDRAFT_628140 [Aspergillus brasiliensis CBS 101740]